MVVLPPARPTFHLKNSYPLFAQQGSDNRIQQRQDQRIVRRLASEALAWVVTENLPKAFYDSIRSFSARQIPTFATREEAMEYLVS